MSRNLRSIDLNLVPVLRALLAEKSVTRAAERVGLTQPAASNALARLRGHFGDSLLVKSGNTMLRTTLGSSLLPLLELACDELERVLHYEIWVPDTVSRKFVVVMSDALAVSIAGELEAILRDQAPKVSIRFGAVGSALRDELVAGRVDIACLGHSSALAKGLNVEAVADYRLEGLVAASHPFASAPPTTTKDFMAAKRIGINIPASLRDDDQSQLFELMQSAAMQMEFSTAHLSTLPHLAKATGALTVVPDFVAAMAEKQFGMRRIAIPETDVSYHLCQYWSPRFATDPGHLWLREILRGLFRRLRLD